MLYECLSSTQKFSFTLKILRNLKYYHEILWKKSFFAFSYLAHQSSCLKLTNLMNEGSQIWPIRGIGGRDIGSSTSWGGNGYFWQIWLNGVHLGDLKVSLLNISLTKTIVIFSIGLYHVGHFCSIATCRRCGSTVNKPNSKNTKAGQGYPASLWS